MTAVRRLLAVLALAVAVVVGSSIPASAAFGAGANLGMGLVTERVEAPSAVSARLVCRQPESTLRLTWTRSSTPRIATYRVTLTFSDGRAQVANLQATATGWNQTIPNESLDERSLTVSVTAITDYGWLRQSTTEGPYAC